MRQEAGEWVFFFFKQKTAYELRISDWSSDVCSSDLPGEQIVVPNLLCAIGEPRLAGLLDKAVQVRRIGLKIDDRVCGLLQAARATAARSEERRVGKECVVRVDLGGRSIIKKKKYKH